MSRFLPWLQSRTPQRIAAVVFASMLLWHFLLFRRGYFSKAQEHLVTAPQVVLDQAILDIQSPCDSLSGLQDVFLAVRTGANEAHERLPVHFNTTLRCLPSGSFGIWSDLEEDIGAHHLQNALDEINPEIMATHPDFEYYKRLQEHGRAAFTTEELTEWGAAPNSAGGRDTPGWKLDKWKFLPIADKAHQQKPDAKWFIFMEGDTYINWRNLLEWLSHIDATKPYYLGNEMQIGDVIFAYGGSGFVISNPAMKSLVEQHANNPGVYEDITADHWAGDCVLGKALFDAGVKLSWQKPNHFGGMPFDMAYGETFGSPLRSLWCYYVTTYHHMTSPDIKEVSAFEQRWAQGRSNLMRHSDVFRGLILPRLGPKIENWENISEDDEGVKDTFEDCRDTCQNKSGCMQYVFREADQTCKTANDIRLGRHKDGQNGMKVTSGWVMDRVDVFVETMDANCLFDQAGWKLPN